MRGGGEVDQRSTGFLDGSRPSGPALTVPPPQFLVGGHDRPNESRAFVHKRILGAARSFVTSGFSPTAALAGFAASPRRAPRPVTRIQNARFTGAPSAPARPAQRIASIFGRVGAALAAARGGACKPGFARNARGKCVRSGVVGRSGAALAAARAGPCRLGFVRDARGKCVRRGRELFDPLGLVGGPAKPRPEVTTMARQGMGEAVVGAFGMPAMVPEEEMRRTLVCPRGMVLGTDDLCYPKGVLSSRNLHRKWRRPPRAPVTAADARAIRKAAATRDRVLQLAKDVGLHASKTRPAKQVKAAHQHLLAPPSQVLRVIAEETN